MLEPVAEHFELHAADSGENGGGVAELVIAQHLDDAFFVELPETAAELLEPARVTRPRHHELLGRKARNAREAHGLVDVERVTDAQVGGVDESDHVAWERFL